MARIACLALNPSCNFCPAASSLKPSQPFSHSPISLRCSGKLRPRGSSLPVTTVAFSRYGGGGRYRMPQADPDYDAALDLDRIRGNSVRLLDEQQNMVGIVSKNEAIRMADDAELVLAILSADADPPVLRLFDSADYKKYKYEQQKKKRVQLKRSAANRMDLKELKMGYNIDSHDYSVRLKAAQKFLKDGDKVKVIVNLKGRENEFRNNAIELIKRFQNDIGENIMVVLCSLHDQLATEESKNFSERNIFIVLMPNKTILQKGQDKPKKKEAPVQEVSASV